MMKTTTSFTTRPTPASFDTAFSELADSGPEDSEGLELETALSNDFLASLAEQPT